MTYANATAWNERPRIVSSARTSGPEWGPPMQPSPSYSGDQRWQVKTELWELFEDCCSDDWDEYEAKGITSECLDVGLEFLDKLPAFVTNPEVAADPDGELSFEWFKSEDMMLTVSVSSERKISYAGIFGQAKAHGVDNFGLEIPTTVLRYLSRYFGNVIPIIQS
jgi:hypothetical protein